MRDRQRIQGVLVGWVNAGGGRRGDAARAAADDLLAALARELGLAVSPISRECPVCGSSAHGRPALGPDAVGSVSYTGGMVVAAVAPTTFARTLGVDVENGDAAVTSDELAVLFSPEPAPTLADWARIEAAVKADGRGFQLAPTEVTLGVGDARALEGPLLVTEMVDAPSGRVIAIAWEPSVTGGVGA